MADILIDNWTLQRAAVSINDVYENIAAPNDDYIRLVEAIILWDNVYFLDNEYSQYWKNILWRFGYQNYLAPFSTGKVEDYEIFQQENGGNSIIADSALKYSTFCNKNNIAYLPCKERAEYLKQCDFIASYVNRKDVMNLLDKTLAEYYVSLNSRFGTDKIRFSFPVLFDFIVANTTDKFFLQTALQVRNEKEVIQFRKWLSSFEQQLQQGALQELEKLLAYLPALICDLTRVVSPKRSAEIQIGLTPAINIPVTFGGSAKNLIHVDFLRTLSSFAINERKPYQPFNNIY